MKCKIVGLLTDFGLRDYYVSAVKAVILSICPEARIIDISHQVTKWNILEGAFILKQSSKYLPEGSVIVGVVDPGVGSKRRSIVIRGEKHYFVGPDNGLLYLAANEEGIKQIIEIRNEKYHLPRSGTFDGRDVFAPIAAHILNGVPISEFGPEIKDIVKIEIPSPDFSGKKLHAMILHVDHFGNIITNIPIAKFLEWKDKSERFLIKIGERIFKASFSTSYELAKTKLFLIPGSSEYMEISVNKGSAAEMLGVKPGDKFDITRD